MTRILTSSHNHVIIRMNATEQWETANFEKSWWP